MQNKKQKSYLVANFTIHDPETFQKYVETGGSLAARFNGRMIAFDATPNIVEGKTEAIMAIMEFDTMTDLEQFYNSPEYTAARQFRIASTTGSIVLLTGIPQ